MWFKYIEQKNSKNKGKFKIKLNFPFLFFKRKIFPVKFPVFRKREKCRNCQKMSFENT